MCAGKPSLQRHLFLTSLSITARAILKLGRDRWCIESFHFLRDTPSSMRMVTAMVPKIR